jgi:hypothetical protein
MGVEASNKTQQTIAPYKLMLAKLLELCFIFMLDANATRPYNTAGHHPK